MKEKEKTHPIEYFVAGGIAGIVSRTCIAPIERVKILFQIGKSSATEGVAWTALAPQILRDEGVWAFWCAETPATALQSHPLLTHAASGAGRATRPQWCASSLTCR